MNNHKQNITYNTKYCNNCNKRGHVLNQCCSPITSFGIIAFRKKDDIVEYLMIERKNSFGYIDFIRGLYSLNNILQLQATFDEMTTIEKKNIQSCTFSELWNEMWGYNSDSDQPRHFNFERENSNNLFSILKNGISIPSIIDGVETNVMISIDYLIENSCTNWSYAEWEFPKGRRFSGERDILCALREFIEETGISGEFITIIDNVTPFEEHFVGTNYKTYRHKYFLAHCTNDIIELDKFQQSEVKQMAWMTYEQCIDHIRLYNVEKKAVLKNVNTLIKEYLIM